jgi:hypothetical protein
MFFPQAEQVTFSACAVEAATVRARQRRTASRISLLARESVAGLGNTLRFISLSSVLRCGWFTELQHLKYSVLDLHLVRDLRLDPRVDASRNRPVH